MLMKRLFLVSLVLLFGTTLSAPSLFGQGAWGATVRSEFQGLVGVWQVRVNSELFDFISLVTVNADGTWPWHLPTVGGDGVSEDSRVACIGPWNRTGARTYHMTLYCLGTQEPNSPRGRYMFDVTLSKDGLTFTDPAFLAEWWMGPLDDSALVLNVYLPVEGTRLPNVPKP
jgi:hypothetical protein